MKPNIAVQTVWLVAISGLGCQKATVSPEPGSDRCVIERSRGDLIVISQVDSYAMLLGGEDWQVSCRSGEPVVMFASNQEVGLMASISPLPVAGGEDELLAAFAQGMMDDATASWQLAPTEAQVVVVGKDQRKLACFGGPIQFSGEAMQLYMCNSIRRRLDGTALACTVMAVTPTPVWNSVGDSIVGAVQASSGAWWLAHEFQ